MADNFTPVMRALVVAALLLASATLMLVAVNTARAAGAPTAGNSGFFGEARDFHNVTKVWRNAQNAPQRRSIKPIRR